MNGPQSGLPREPVNWLTRPFLRFLRIEATAGIILLGSTLLALVLANAPGSDSFLAFWDLQAGINVGAVELSRSIRHWINDGLMTFFFFVISLELKREVVLGELRHPRMTAVPIAAAVGGMIVPVAVFLLIVGTGSGASGWGTVMSTDTAFVIGCLAALGSRVPISLRLFLLSLAIFDDVGAILVVAIVFGESLNVMPLVATALGLVLVATIARAGVRVIPVYFALGGGIWLALDASGIHATLAGVILGLMTPARSWVSDSRLHAILERVTAYPPGDHWTGDMAARGDLYQAGVATREVLSPLERLEMALHPWVAFVILPLFALANAGVPFARADFDPVLTTAIVAAFVIGKPSGVFLFSLLAVKSGLGVRPPSLSWSLLAAGGLLTGVGFTMALFMADLSLEAHILDSVKLSILGASVISALLGLMTLAWITSSR